MSAIQAAPLPIDAAALVLYGRLIETYYMRQDPNVPLTDTLADVIREATATECEVMAARAKYLKELGSVVEELIGKITDKGLKRGTVARSSKLRSI
jgi:hypothetical protein